ncbi:hypothetical protein QTJ16_007056 [Diplocarpon rosae]|uniref:Sequence orphan n=1 Tax=Diplocarpon rosae TaxID=946125 RepID=A0AAD9SU72_9HELO|nr:hypothetical protein QTJ16_007056 [Diplocarpon rosae]
MTRHSSKLEPPVPDLTMEAPKPLSPLRKAAEAPLVESRIWNTKNLGLRLGADFASGAGAATMVAPLITIIDKAIMQNASGQASLKSSLVDSLKTVLLRPQTLLFSKPFALICMLYGGTYFTANSLDTITSTVRNRPASHVTSGTAKFAASSAANVGLCLVKDATFAKLDCLTIFASFNIPPLLGPAISQRMNRELEKTISGQTIAQFAAPAAVQLVSTPMHLLGLDLYNRGSVGTWGDRWQIVKRNWGISAAARICRIVPAFGLGGVVNCNVRRSLMGRLE